MAQPMYSQAQLENMRYRELQGLAKTLRVKANGPKDNVVTRLIGYYDTLTTTRACPERHNDGSSKEATPSNPPCSPTLPPKQVSEPIACEERASRLADTWSDWVPKNVPANQSRTPLHVEQTVEWEPQAVADRYFKHRDPARHAYAQMYRTLNRRARSIPPFHHEDPESDTPTPLQRESKIPELEPSYIQDAECGSDAGEHKPDAPEEISTARVESYEHVSHADVPRTSNLLQEASQSSPLHSSVQSLFSQPLSYDSQVTAPTTQPVEPSQPNTEGSSQDPWPAYGHSQRASPDPYEAPDATEPHRYWIPESQPITGSAEAISLSQLLESSQPQEDDAPADDADGSPQRVEAQPGVDARAVQRIVEGTVEVFRATLAQAQLGMHAYDEVELRDVLASIVRGAATIAHREAKEAGGSATKSSAEAKELPHKRRHDDHSDSEGPSAHATRRRRL